MSKELLLDDRDMAVGLAELHLQGLIKFEGDECYRLTDEGIKAAYAMLKDMPSKTRILLFTFISDINLQPEEGR